MSDGERLSITLVTGYTSDHPDRLKMSKKVVENQFAYANRHNYHYLEYKNNLAETYEPYWSKIKIINNWLDSNNGASEDKWLVWLDDDMIIMDPSIKVEDLISKHAGAKSVIIAKDAISWHAHPESSINTGILFVKNTQESRDFFNKVWDKRNESFTYTEKKKLIKTTLGKCKDQKCLHEQAAMADLLEHNQGRCVAVIDQRDKDNIGINTFIREKAYFSLRSNKPHESNYHSDPLSSVASPGDFAAQCTGIPMLGRKHEFDNTPNSPLRLETAEIILNCVALLTDAEKQ